MAEQSAAFRGTTHPAALVTADPWCSCQAPSRAVEGWEGQQATRRFRRAGDVPEHMNLSFSLSGTVPQMVLRDILTGQSSFALLGRGEPTQLLPSSAPSSLLLLSCPLALPRARARIIRKLSLSKCQATILIHAVTAMAASSFSHGAHPSKQ